MSSDKSQDHATRELAVADHGNQAALEPQQETALQLLQTGQTVAQAAQVIGVSRGTIYYWLKREPVFAAAYNQWHNEMAETARSKLAILSDKAVGALDKALEAGDAKAALQLLKGLGFIRPRDEAEQITDAQELRVREEHARQRKNIELRKEKGRLKDDELTADLGF